MREAGVWAVILAVGLFPGVQTVCSAAILNDGQVHTIDYTVDFVDVFDGPDPPPPDVTTVILVDGGEVSDALEAFEHSEVSILGGTIGADLEVHDQCQVLISGGTIGEELQVLDDCRITITGGDLRDGIEAYGQSEITITGGLLGLRFYAANDCRISIFGTDFAVDGSPVGYGPVSAPIGELTGTLQNGDPLFAMFMVQDNASVILLPEPAALLLFALGGLAIRRKRR